VVIRWLLWIALGECGFLLLAWAGWFWLGRVTRRLWEEARIGRQRDVRGVPPGGQVLARHRRHVRLKGIQATCGALVLLCLVALFGTGLTALLMWRDRR